MRACAGLAWAALAAAGATAALAQSYPLKPIRVASDSASGSPGDVALRLVAVKMGAALGQPVVVETKTGAGGQIAAMDVIRSGANGYSLHLQWLSFMLATDTSLLHVPYGSGNNSQRLNDFLVGRTSLVFTPYGSVKPYLEAGKVRALAMVSDQRNRQAPDVPAITEVIPSYKLFVGFWGFWGPAGLPQPIVERPVRGNPERVQGRGDRGEARCA